MREYVSRKKQTTTDVSMPSLKHPIRGFGIESPAPAPQPLPERQTLNEHSGKDIISRISFQPQTKLTVNRPGDIFEQEADRVAQQVMRRIDRSGNRPSIQRQSAPEDEELQMKPLSSSITSLQRQEVPEEEELQMKPLDVNTLQRQQAPEEEEELQMSPMVQRQANAEMAAAPDLEASINQARGGGQVMADNIREPMEVAFGADFSGVKVHTDGQSDQLNQSIQARAFTTGQDVFFRQGEYNPGSRGGQELLAHELTHVVQQNHVQSQQTDSLGTRVSSFDASHIQRSIDTAASALHKDGIKTVRKNILKPKFCKQHEISVTDIETIQISLDELWAGQRKQIAQETQEVDVSNMVLLIKDKIGQQEEIRVYLDSHQNKHQHPESMIAELGIWTKKKGTLFASGKGLAWHQKNTAETIKNWAMQQQYVDKQKHIPKKTAMDDGYIYDASAFKEGNVIYVTYHCNPEANE